MSEVLFDIYNDAYSVAIQGGASEEDARVYAEQCRKEVEFAYMYL